MADNTKKEPKDTCPVHSLEDRISNITHCQSLIDLVWAKSRHLTSDLGRIFSQLEHDAEESFVWTESDHQEITLRLHTIEKARLTLATTLSQLENQINFISNSILAQLLYSHYEAVSVMQAEKEAELKQTLSAPASKEEVIN